MRLHLFAFILLVLLGVSVPVLSQPSHPEAGAVLETVEKFFATLKRNDSRSLWGMLSEKSRSTIVRDVYKAVKDTKNPPTEEQVRADFTETGPLAVSYWGGVLKTFDPDMLLTESRWQMGKVSKNKAEVLAEHKTAKKPAVIQVFKEKGEWKVGLVETFWTRK